MSGSHYKAFIDSYKAIKAKDAFQERTQKGKLPIIEINGHPFYVDIRMGYLRPKDDFSTLGIPLDQLVLHPETGSLCCYFNIKTHELAHIDLSTARYPADIVQLDIPNLYVLDAVGMARSEGKNDNYYSMRDGLSQNMYHCAKLTPLQQTEVASIIEKNKNTVARSQTSPKQVMRGRLKRKGKGL